MTAPAKEMHVSMPVSDRIAADYRQRIRSGELPVGTVLPTVAAIQAEYFEYRRAGRDEVSVMPVRQALYALRNEGLIEFRPGVGNVVIEPRSPDG